MDATALRWVLAIIGIAIIAGIYLYSLFQNKQRREAAVKTFTNEEIESGFIEDETLRAELSNINAMLDEEINESEINQIKINPGLEGKSDTDYSSNADIELPEEVCKLLPDHRIVHILKPLDDHLLTGSEINNALQHSDFVLNDQFRFYLANNSTARFQILNLSIDGSFENIQEEQFTSQGLVCCIKLDECSQPFSCYETMLKKVDELVRILDLKVYSHNLDLLTLQHVTEIRKQLLAENKTETDDSESDSGNGK